MTSSSRADVNESIEAVWRLESTRLVAALVRMTRDVGLAEDLAQEALVAALSQWPDTGMPANPGAWLMAVAKRRAIDGFRRRERQDKAYGQIAEGIDNHIVDDIASAVDHIEDDVLRLMFVCCHPALGSDAQVTLTLRLLAGLSATEIARSFLTSEPTISARITRAKKTLAQVSGAMEEPSGQERAERLNGVMRVVYLLFNEGYSATSGDDWMRAELCDEAIRLGRVLVALVPSESEAHGLIALMELQHSRAPARVDADGTPILLLDQDRSRWDGLLIRRGLSALDRAIGFGQEPGPYVLQAEIAAVHARARRPEDTDWARIASLYATLAAVTGSVVVELNRAVALSKSEGPAAGLALLDQLVDFPALAAYHLLPSVRGDLLLQLGRSAEARAEFERAAALTSNRRERTMLLDRAACAQSEGKP